MGWRLIVKDIQIVITAFGLAGFAGPYAGGFLKDVTGTYSVPFALSAGMVSISVFLSLIIKTPVRTATRRE